LSYRAITETRLPDALAKVLVREKWWKPEVLPPNRLRRSIRVQDGPGTLVRWSFRESGQVYGRCTHPAGFTGPNATATSPPEEKLNIKCGWRTQLARATL